MLVIRSPFAASLLLAEEADLAAWLVGQFQAPLAARARKGIEVVKAEIEAPYL